MSRPQLGKYLWQLLVAILPVPITIWLTVLYVQDSGSVTYFEYRKSSREAFVALPDTLPSKLQLIYDGQPVENLSSVKFQVFNRTGKSYQNVKLYFEIHPLDGTSPQLLSKDIHGPESFPLEGFSELSPKASSVGWNIATVNSSASLLDAFEVTLVFLGQKAPKVDIALLKTGVALTLFKAKEPSNTLTFLKMAGIVIGLALYITLVFLLMRRAARRVSRFRRDLREEIATYFQNNKERLAELDEDALASEVLAVYRETREKRRSHVDKAILGLLGPLIGDRTHMDTHNSGKQANQSGDFGK